MSPLRIGIGLAAVVAGPPLYALVQRGDIDLVTALTRGSVVAAGCVIGASTIARIVAQYERTSAAERRRAAVIEAALRELNPPPSGG
jgi:hypothetical protein